jgi:membrane associated rhomboid family serine protease
MALPGAIRAFIGISVVVYLIQVVASFIPIGGQNGNRVIIEWLAFNPSIPQVFIQPWRFITYIFLHGSPFHLIFNLLWLWWMGRPVEERIGPRSFTTLFLGAGIGGALLDIPLSLLFGGANVIGASGAVYGIMVAFAMLYPTVPIMLFLLPPLEARYVVAGIIVIDVLFLGTGDGVARIVHIGGAGVGYLLMKAYFSGSDLSAPIRAIERLWTQSPQDKKKSRMRSVFGNSKNSQGISDVDIIEEKESNELDEILEKIAKSGYDGLTKSEKNRLFELSKRK